MQNTIKHGGDYFKIKCTSCNEKLAEGETLDKMLGNFFQKLYDHNNGSDNRLCSSAKKELDFVDLSKAFKGDYYSIYVPTDFEVKATKWQKSSEMIGDIK